MFKKNEYVVILETTLNNSDCVKNNFIFKQAIDLSFIAPYIDLRGDVGNNNTSSKFDKSDTLKNWRYATPKESAHYELLGKPYDVTTLPKFVLPEKWCVKDTCDEESNGLYEYANKYGVYPEYNACPDGTYIYYHFPSFDRCTTRSDKAEGYTEITLTQFKTYVLGNVIVKEDYSYLIEFLTTKGIK